MKSNFGYTLADILHRYKGFEVATTSRNNERVLIDYDGKRYLVNIREVENKSKDIHEDMERYL